MKKDLTKTNGFRLALMISLTLCLLFAFATGVSAEVVELSDTTWITIEENDDTGVTNPATITGFDSLNPDAPKEIKLMRNVTDKTVTPNKTYTITRIGTNAFANAGLTKVTSENTNNSNTTCQIKVIGDYAFSGNVITELTLPNTTEIIGHSAFRTCPIQNIDLSNTQIEIIKQWAFYNSACKSIKLPNTLRIIGQVAFFGEQVAENERVVVPAQVEYIGMRGISAKRGVLDLSYFAPGDINCQGMDNDGRIKWGDPGNFNAGSDSPFIFNPTTGIIAGVKDDFNTCADDKYVGWTRSTGRLEIPAQIGKYRVKGLWTGAFHCTPARQVLKEVEFTGDHIMKTIPAMAFKNCTSLVSIENIPASVETLESNCFSDTRVQSLDFPGVTSVKTFATYYPFQSCNRLKSVSFGSGSVKLLANLALGGDNVFLEDVFLPNMEKDSVEGAPWGAVNATIHWAKDENGVEQKTEPLVQTSQDGKWKYAPTRNQICEYIGADVYDISDFVIPKEIDGIPIYNVGDGASRIFRQTPLPTFDSVTFEAGSEVTEIMRSAFQSVKIKEITLPENLEVINWGTFVNCGIETITELPNGCHFPDSLRRIWSSFSLNNLSGTIKIPGNIGGDYDDTMRLGYYQDSIEYDPNEEDPYYSLTEADPTDEPVNVGIDSPAFANNPNITKFIIEQYKYQETDEGAFNRDLKRYRKADQGTINNAPFSAYNATVEYMDKIDAAPKADVLSNAIVDPDDNTATLRINAYTTNNFWIVKDIKVLNAINGEELEIVEYAPNKGQERATIAELTNIKGNNTEPGYIFKVTMVRTAEKDKTNASLETSNITIPVKAFHKVTFNRNNPAVSGVDPEVQGEYIEGARISTVDNPYQNVQEGYAFDGWCSEKDGSGNYAAGGEDIFMTNEDMTVYAQWQRNVGDVDVTFDGNGGKFRIKNADADTNTLKYNKDELFSVNDFCGYQEPTKLGSKFAGWSVVKDNSEQANIRVGVPADYTEATLTVYALWDNSPFVITGPNGETIVADPELEDPHPGDVFPGRVIETGEGDVYVITDVGKPDDEGNTPITVAKANYQLYTDYDNVEPLQRGRVYQNEKLANPQIDQVVSCTTGDEVYRDYFVTNVREPNKPTPGDIIVDVKLVTYNVTPVEPAAPLNKPEPGDIYTGVDGKDYVIATVDDKGNGVYDITANPADYQLKDEAGNDAGIEGTYDHLTLGDVLLDAKGAELFVAKIGDDEGKGDPATGQVDVTMKPAVSVADVVAMINKISDPVTLADEPAVVAARNGYNRMPDSEKEKFAAEAAESKQKLEDAEKAIADLKAAQEVIDKIDAIGVVTLDKEDQIKDARDSYEALTDDQKALVPEETLNTLAAAEAKLAELKNDPAKARQAEIDNVKDLIGKISDPVTLEDAPVIAEAREAYDKLDDGQKAEISDAEVKKLEDAEKAIADLTAAKAVEEMIDAIGVVTLAKEPQIKAAREAYENLSRDQQELVGNEDVLKAAEDELKRLQNEPGEDEKARIANVEDLISKLPDPNDVTLADEDAIKAAREAFDALPQNLQDQVKPALVQKLDSAETALDVLKAQNALDLIDKIPDNVDDITIAADGKNIDAAEKAYDDLTDGQKAIVEAKDAGANEKLDAAVEKLAELRAAKAAEDQAKADAVKELIDKIPANVDDITIAKDGETIEAAAKAFDDLTDDQKALLSDEDKAKLAAAEDRLDDLKAAEKVTGMIDDIGVVTLDKEPQIKAAREAYEALTDEQKALVDDETVQKLSDAEATLDELKADAAKARQAEIDNVEDLIGKINVPATIDDVPTIEAASAAYDKLDDGQKAEIKPESLAKLEEAKAALDDLKAAKDVKDAIDGIGVVTLAKEDQIKAARDAYEALTDAQKGYLDDATVQKLADAEAELARLKAAGEGSDEASQAKIDNVKDLIGKIVEPVTLADEPIIKAAREAYDDLTDAEKAKIDPADVKKLEDAEKRLDELKAQEVIDLIDAIPDPVTVDDEDDVKKADDAYNNLTDKQKEIVDQKDPEAKDKLDKAKEDLEKAKAEKEAEDQKAADAVEDKINALPDPAAVTPADEAAIKDARDSYDALTDDQKAKVDPEAVKKLEDAEKALDQAKAKAVTDQINALPPADQISEADRAAVEAARAAYEALTPEQKALVPADVLKKLEDAEKALAAGDPVKEVEAQIKALPTAAQVKDTDAPAVKAARDAYDKLSDADKAKVDPALVTKLEGVEKAIAVLTCKKDNTCPLAKFTDLKPGSWYHDGIHYCLENGLMNGTGATTFAPNADTSRAMIVTIIWRMENEPEGGSNPFNDVKKDSWYDKAVAWANANNIVNGYGGGKFGPNDPITREQYAAIMYRYAEYKKYDVSKTASLDQFPDKGQLHDWAAKEMTWAFAEGLITGTTGANNSTILDPRGKATRAQAATIMQRFCTNIAK